jgi:hypothetical protein
MKKILAAIGGAFVAVYHAFVGGGDPTIVQIPANLQITPTEIDDCIKAVNIIKDVVNNPVTVLVTDLTPISMDNDIRLDIANALPGILAGLTFAKGLITGVDDSDDQINALLANVRLSDDPDKDALYHNLAARLIMIASKGSVSWSDAVGILELYFKQIFGTGAVATVAETVITSTVNGGVPAAFTAPAPGAAPASPVASAAASAAPAVAVAGAIVDAAAPGAAPVVDAVEQTATDIANNAPIAQTVANDLAPAVIDLTNLTDEQKAIAIAALQTAATVINK